MVKKIAAIFFYLSIVAYIIWEIYWYNQVGLSFIKWHTHLALPFIAFLFLYHIFKAFNVSKKIMNALFFLFLTIQLFEFFVQVTGIGKTQTEKVYGHFSLSNKHNTLERFYWIDKPHTIKNLKTEEFHFTRQINSEGFSDFEWKIEKKADEFRILCLGDSFTEGDGAHQDSSYIAFLKKKIEKDNIQNITVMNAGKCGSDPFFNYMNFKDLLQKHKSDVIIQTLSTNDLYSDIILRGGFERFENNWGLAFDKHNVYGSALYALSYTSRLFYYLVNSSSEPSKEQKHKVFNEVMDLFSRYSKLAAERGAKLIIVFLPQSNEVFENYPNLTIACKEALEKRYTTFDLREFYQKVLNEKSICNYYWVKDGHHNAKGYNLMAEGICEFLKSENLIYLK